MEVAPAVPAGYQLLAISQGELQQTPGLAMSARELANYGNRSTIISVMPTADAPAGAIISWSGYARAGLVYESTDADLSIRVREDSSEDWEEVNFDNDDVDDDDIDVYARGQLRVKASTDTAVGEVGVDMRIRANFDGIESEGNDFYMDVAYGYWAMTPELTFGGGYAGSLGEVGYSFDASCSCHYTDTVGFNPGDTSQMRLSYGSGPFSMAIALEDASLEFAGLELDERSGDALGVAGEIKYSGDTFSAEVAGVWRSLEDDDDFDDVFDEILPDSWWQVGAGVGFALGDIANFNIAAAMGEGPTLVTDSNTTVYNDVFGNPWNNSWWGVSGLISVGLSDEVHAELGAGYVNREFDDFDFAGGEFSADSDRWVVGGGLYYNPVDQLTIGVEASYTDIAFEADVDSDEGEELQLDLDTQTMIVDLVAVWRF